MICYIKGSRWWSLRQALLRSLKARHSLISPLFFQKGTRLSTHKECLIGKIIFSSMNLENYFLISSSILGLISLCFCLTGLEFSSKSMVCWDNFGSKPFKCSYGQSITSWNSWHYLMKTSCPILLNTFPKLRFLPLAIVIGVWSSLLANRFEPFLFAWLSELKIPSKVTIPLGN